MELTAKFVSLGQATEGTNKQGNPWRKATATFETEEKYPKTVAIDFFNANIDTVSKIKFGTVCNIKLDAQSREYKGKWYTNLTGYGIEAASQAQQAPAQPLEQTPGIDEEESDLPF